MVRPALRSTSLRNLKKTKPSGKATIHYERRRPDMPKCALCKNPINGLPRLRPAEFRKLGKSKHTVNRPYGGNLCSSCSRQKIKDKHY